MVLNLRSSHREVAPFGELLWGRERFGELLQGEEFSLGVGGERQQFNELVQGEGSILGSW